MHVLLSIRLAAMNRELKMKELQLLDATRRKFLNFTQQQKEAEIVRLDDEIRRKVTAISTSSLLDCYFVSPHTTGI